MRGPWNAATRILKAITRVLLLLGCGAIVGLFMAMLSCRVGRLIGWPCGDAEFYLLWVTWGAAAVVVLPAEFKARREG